MIIDSHVHIGSANGKVKFANVEETIRQMDVAGVDKAICFLYPDADFDNEQFFQVVKSYRDRIIPYVWLNPKDADVKEQLIHFIDDLSFKGLKLHPLVHEYDLADLRLLDPLMREADQRKMHIIIHCTSDNEYVNVDKVEMIAKTYSNCIIQLAHMGAIYDGNKAIEAASRNQNLYLDTGIASMNCIRRAILKVPNKILMGCDFPSYTFTSEMTKIREACILADAPDVFRKICGENAMHILTEKI